MTKTTKTTTDIILRAVPSSLHAALRVRAAQDDVSLSSAIIKILTAALMEPSDSVSVGFVPVAGGELGADYVCPECGNPAGDGGLFLPVVGVKKPQVAQPVCRFCATCE